MNEGDVVLTAFEQTDGKTKNRPAIILRVMRPFGGNSGMFWSVEGTQNILTLRTALLGEHFDRDWDARSQVAA